MFDQYDFANDKELLKDSSYIYTNVPEIQEQMKVYEESEYYSEIVSYACTDCKGRCRED